MQATATVKRLQGNEIRIAAIIVALLGVLAVGTVVTVTRDDASSTRAVVPTYVESKTNDNFRFAEMNALPEAAAVRPLTYEQFRFKEINQLPEAAALRPMTQQQIHFLEINQLPEAAPAAPVTFEKMRFVEINQLPGDGAPLVAPSSDRLGERY